jgi:signal transduction histidine kinase
MGKYRILIVDDNERNTAIVKRILQNHYNLLDVVTGEEALEIAESFRPDIVLLDIMLPGIDGYEVCRRLRRNVELSNTKIIMVTAKAMIGEKLNGYEAGADDYVTKPFDGEELLAKVEVYLRLKTVEEHEALKSNLLTLLGHETRTPLTYIKAAAESLMTIESTSAVQRQFARIIHEGTTRIADVLTKALWYGELTSDCAIEPTTRCEVESLIDGIVTSLAYRADARGIKVARGIRRPTCVMADVPKLSGALEIILDNAISFSPDDDVVTVEIAEEDDEVRILVRDKGPGIPKDKLPHLFEGLHSSDVSHHSRGHNLNLAIARVILEGHGGTLEAETSEGLETTFTVRLPASAPAAPVKSRV